MAASKSAQTSATTKDVATLSTTPATASASEKPAEVSEEEARKVRQQLGLPESARVVRGGVPPRRA